MQEAAPEHRPIPECGESTESAAPRTLPQRLLWCSRIRCCKLLTNFSIDLICFWFWFLQMLIKSARWKCFPVSLALLQIIINKTFLDGGVRHLWPINCMLPMQLQLQLQVAVAWNAECLQSIGIWTASRALWVMSYGQYGYAMLAKNAAKHINLGWIWEFDVPLGIVRVNHNCAALQLIDIEMAETEKTATKGR